MSKLERIDFLTQHGSTLIDNGYNIVPIPPKAKSPGFDGWQKTRATKNLLLQWLDEGKEDFGIGIVTKHAVAIDLDITDESVVKKVLDFVELRFGSAPVRVGRAPKCILLMRCDEPFRKMKTGKFADEWDERHEVEILAEGQQFVAYGLHKDTGEPYRWITELSPVNTPIDDLPTVDADSAKEIIAYANSVFTDLGWKRLTNGLVAGLKVDHDDPFAEIEQAVDLPPEEIRARLLTIPGNGDYDKWYTIGMALYHQYDGGDEGLAMWHEWSETADNYDAEALDAKWTSFAIEGKKRAPVTARTIIAFANEAASERSAKEVIELRDAFFNAKDAKDWRDACFKTKRSEIDSVSRAEIGEIARTTYSRITGVKISMVEVRKTIAYEPKKSENQPHWLKDWVFDAQEDKFYNLTSKMSMTTNGFNMVFSRQALTKKDIVEGRSTPSRTPVELAMDVFKIPEVYGREYAPDEDPLFRREGYRIANTYPAYQVPVKKPESDFTPADKWAIRKVKKHIAHLLPDPEEQALFTDWLAFIVQNPGKLVNWAMVLQGTEGDGKSFFGFLLREVMGVSNVRMVNANILEGNFNGWSQGQCVIVIEEPRLQGHNRYDVLNKIKPLITNSVIEIHAKGRDPYNVLNTSNYFLPTNFRDALPIGSNDRRYCVMFSRWQSRDMLSKFKLENPDYYRDLYQSIKDTSTVRALRTWLLGHQISDDFPAGGDAPRTKAHSYMVNAAKSDVFRAVEEVMTEGLYPDITEDIINASRLPDALIGHDIELPKTQGLARMLEHNGFSFIGRIRLGGAMQRMWARNPEMFRDGAELSQQLVRAYVAKRKADMSEL